MGSNNFEERTSIVTYRVQNPMTDEVVETFPTASAEDVEQALTDAAGAAKHWGTMEIGERAEIILQVSKLFDDRKAGLCQFLLTGKLFGLLVRPLARQ